jgi:hypothetical protein
MNKVIIILVFVVSYFTGSSQAPGYMGKRFTAGYGIYGSPGFVGSDGRTPVNVLHEAFVEFAAKKKFSVGLSAKFYNAITPNSTEASTTVFGFNNYQSLRETPEGTTRLKGKNYMLYGKFFKRKYLAPWGKYFILGVALNTYTTIYDPDQVYIAYQNTNSGFNDNRYFTDFGATKQSFMKVDVTFGNGRSRIIADRIALDYGYTINVWSLTSNVINVLGESGNYVSADDYMKTIGAKRAKGVNAFNLFLKVGYLF